MDLGKKSSGIADTLACNSNPVQSQSLQEPPYPDLYYPRTIVLTAQIGLVVCCVY